ncbi:cell division protein ZapB [Bradyrhizobium sp. Pa8]|uniref:cell division protein ZapB n=1 Tax=Bradyrhizobium sp. Pa8 TaxID=3386552 RepID=UPI00403F7BDC
MTKQTKQVATQDQIIEIYEELKRALKKTGERTIEYLDGNTDVTVAAKLGVGVQSVISIRTKRFGTFFERGDTPPGGNFVSALRDEVAALQRALDRQQRENETLSREVGELRQENRELRQENLQIASVLADFLPRYNKLIDTLVLPPHSVSVRHLKVPTNDKPPVQRG